MTHEGNARNQTWKLDKDMILEYLYKVGSEWELNSWPDSSVAYSVWREFSGCGFNSHSGQLFIATSKILQCWISYVPINSLTNVINNARFRFKKIWWLTKGMPEMKCEHWTKRWYWSICTKLALTGSWTHDLMAQLVRASQWPWVQIPLRPTFSSYFKNLSVANTICIDSICY